MSRNFLFFAFWGLATVVMGVGLVVGLWLALPSAMLMQVHDMTYDPATKQITMTRTVLGDRDILARWRMSVAAGAIECADSGEAIYEARQPDGAPKTRVTFPAGDRLLPCLETDQERVIVASWQVLLLGVIPLRQTFLFKPPRL